MSDDDKTDQALVVGAIFLPLVIQGVMFGASLWLAYWLGGKLADWAAGSDGKAKETP